jgi:hypothetical protein
MSTENKKKVLLGFGAFAVVLIAVLAIWRPPAFRSEDASGSIGAVQKHHAPQITQQDVILGNETTRHEQQIRYADFLNDAAKLRSISARVTADNVQTASQDVATMRSNAASRWQTEAKVAFASAQALAREAGNQQMDAAVTRLAALNAGGQLNDSAMRQFDAALAEFSDQFAARNDAERIEQANREVVAAVSDLESHNLNAASLAAAKLDSAATYLKAMNSMTLADRARYLSAMEVEVRELAMMASRPQTANQLDALATRLESQAMRNLEMNVGELEAMASALQQVDSNIAAAQRTVDAAAMGSSRQAYNKSYVNVRGALDSGKQEFDARAHAAISGQLAALNAYLGSVGQSGVRAANVREMGNFLGMMSQRLAGNNALAASLADHGQLAARANALKERALAVSAR